MNSSGDFILTPNHLTKSWISLSQLPEDPITRTLDPQLKKLEDDLQSLFTALGSRGFMENLKMFLISNTSNYKLLKQQSSPLRASDVVLVSRRQELFLGVVERLDRHHSQQFYWIRRKKYNHLVSEKINMRKLHLLHRPHKSEVPPASGQPIIDLRASRAVIQARLLHKPNVTQTLLITPRTGSGCMDDVILRSTPPTYQISGKTIFVNIPPMGVSFSYKI